MVSETRIIFLVCGSREWDNWLTIAQVLAKFSQNDIMIHGDCPDGADAIAKKIWTAWGRQDRAFPAEWKKYGKAAGPRRNTQMLDVAHPTYGLAFQVGNSSGTADMMAKMTKYGVPFTKWTKP